jgi:hypothetical protein
MLSWLKRVIKYNRWRARIYDISPNGLKLWDRKCNRWIDADYNDMRPGDITIELWRRGGR